MKSILAALVLLLQLQPILGTAVCLGLSDRAEAECQIPEHGAMPEHGAAMPQSTVAQPELPAPNCALASACAPSPLTIVSLPENLESIVALYSKPLVMAATTLFGVSSAPPFHPPRA
jgi:hypothetical protein